MATTIPRTWTGIPSLSEAKVAEVTEWYGSALADSDKAGDEADEAYYSGQAEAYAAVLDLLFGT